MFWWRAGRGGGVTFDISRQFFESEASLCLAQVCNASIKYVSSRIDPPRPACSIANCASLLVVALV